MVLFGFFVIISDVYNSYGDLSFINYANLKSDYEKSEKKESFKNLIFVDFIIFFVLFISYFFAVPYAIIEKNYFKEYFPYRGSEHNGIGFLILLKYIIRIQPPIYFLVFFPLMHGDYNPIISNYFKLFKFSIDNNYWPIIKGCLLGVILIFVGCGLTRDGIIKLFKEGRTNKYAKIGAQYCGVKDKNNISSLESFEIKNSEED